MEPPPRHHTRGRVLPDDYKAFMPEDGPARLPLLRHIHYTDIGERDD